MFWVMILMCSGAPAFSEIFAQTHFPSLPKTGKERKLGKKARALQTSAGLHTISKNTLSTMLDPAHTPTPTPF